jgi:MFS transporter, SHS family, lactate transporter
LYSQVQGILVGSVAAFVFLITIIGPECALSVFGMDPFTDLQSCCRNRAAHFEKAKAAFEEGAANDELEPEEFNEKISDDKEHADIELVNRI